jgi:hypothetical protein
MKIVLAILGGMAAMASVAVGQGLSVEATPDQEQYLPGETLIVKVRMANYSGQNLPLGKDAAWLSFSLEDARHLPLAKQGPVPVTGEFNIEPSMTATKKVNLAPYYDLTQPGRYYVSATVTVPQWGRSVQSKQVYFDIIAGNNVWEQEFGVPGTAKENSAPELRRYALVQTIHSKVPRLYFRLTSAREGQLHRIMLLGPVVSFSNPEPEIDQFSNFHVLYQAAGRTFMHYLFNPDGVLLARETYEYSDSRPVLRAHKDGRITVVGGTRLVQASDLPPPTTANVDSNAKTPTP